MFIKKIIILNFCIIFFLFFFSGCASFNFFESKSENTASKKIIVPKIRLTKEKVQTKNGKTYLIVVFPKNSQSHKLFYDKETGEAVVACILFK